MSTQAIDPMQKMLGRTFGAVLAFGLVTILIGVILMVFTQESVKFFAVMTAIYLLISGIFMLVSSFTTDVGGTGLRVLSALAGVASILLGIYALRDIAQAVEILVLLIGFAWIIRGIAEVIDGIASPGMPGRGWAIFMGALSLVAGIVVLVWPVTSIGVLVWVTGLWLVVLGIVEVIGSFQLRKLADAV
jgi:uncharacterized membrane protein HdeD (DUF308 family)